MTAALSDNNDLGSVTDILTESPLTLPLTVPITSFHKKVCESTDCLCFVSYKGANTLQSCWYPVQIVLEDDDIDPTTGSYQVEFFRCHPDNMHKLHDISRWWPDWYEIMWEDKTTKTSFNYGQIVLV